MHYITYNNNFKRKTCDRYTEQMPSALVFILVHILWIQFKIIERYSVNSITHLTLSDENNFDHVPLMFSSNYEKKDIKIHS